MKTTTFKFFKYNDSYGRNSVPVKDIVRIKAVSNYVQVFLCNGNSATPYMQLKEVRKILCKKNSFLFIHRSHIVNIAYVKEIVKGNARMQNFAVMKTGDLVPIRRRCVEKLREIINSL